MNQAQPADGRLWAELTNSVFGRIAARVADVAVPAASESVAMRSGRKAAKAFRHLPVNERFRFIGLVFVVASVTNVALLASQPQAGGWWLILPGLAGVFGLVTLALSFAVARTPGVNS